MSSDKTESDYTVENPPKRKRGRPSKHFSFPISERLANLGEGVNLNELESVTITDEFLERRLAFVVLSLERQIADLEAERDASTAAIESTGGQGTSDLIRHRTAIASHLKTARAEHAKAVLALSKGTGYFGRQQAAISGGSGCEHCGSSGGGIRVIMQNPDSIPVEDAEPPEGAFDLGDGLPLDDGDGSGKDSTQAPA